eukprot:SAG31_NODE_4150_length_3528_cov_4.950714_2_plen_66_part_00
MCRAVHSYRVSPAAATTESRYWYPSTVPVPVFLRHGDFISLQEDLSYEYSTKRVYKGVGGSHLST